MHTIGANVHTSSGANYNISRLNILIVDDNRHMRTLVKSLLFSFGAKTIREASDGADAFKEMRTFPADMVITDWVMSPLDGIEFVRLMRDAEDSPAPFVPIIMLSGYTERWRIQEAINAGVHLFLAKPVSARTLYTRIVKLIENPASFIRTKNYFGPDRRDIPREDAPAAPPAPAADMGRTDIDAMFN